MKNKRFLVVALILIALVGAGYYAWNERAAQNTVPSSSSLPSSQIPQIDPKIIGKVVKDSSGKEYMSNQIIVEFRPEVSEADALALIDSLGGKMQQRFTAVPLFLVLVDDPGDGSASRALAKKFAADPKVKSADLNYLTTVN
jgi:hypothetical protein